MSRRAPPIEPIENLWMEKMLNLLRYAFILAAFLSAGWAMAGDIHRELEDIANRLATKIEETQRTNVAVADFTDLHSVVHELGRFISEEVSTNLVLSARGFSVIDRNHLRTILKEQKLSMSGLMDPENQKKLGKILGVDALILGSITPFGESYRVTFKVVATDTARVIAAERGMVPKTPATDELWDTIIEYDFGTEAVHPTGTIPSTTRAPGVPVIVRQQKKGEYGSQYLTFAIESLGLSKNKKSATLVGRLTNVSKQNIYVAAHKKAKDNPGINMVDDVGGHWVRASAAVGLTTYPHDAAAMMRHKEASGSPYGHKNINNYFGLLTPGQSQPVNIVFKPVGDPKVFSFGANLFLKVPETAAGRKDEQGTLHANGDRHLRDQGAVGAGGPAWLLRPPQSS